jgi:hypothetical protein
MLRIFCVFLLALACLAEQQDFTLRTPVATRPVNAFSMPPVACPPNVTVDACGLCNGTITNVTLCVPGCDGVNASGAVYDTCGVCEGDNSACVCNTQRWAFWVLGISCGLLSVPLIYCIHRYWVFTVRWAPYWLIDIPSDRRASTGQGAFYTHVYHEQQAYATISTIVVSLVWIVMVVIRMVFSWTSDKEDICANLRTFNFYVPLATFFIGLMGLLAIGSYAKEVHGKNASRDAL